MRPATTPDVADLLDGIPGEAAAGASAAAVSQRRLPPSLEASGDQAELLDATLYVAQPPAARRWALPAPRELLLTGAPPLVAALLLVLAWELWIRVREVPIYLAPAPSRVIETLSAEPARFIEAGSVSAQHALGGLLLGAGSAFLLGVLMAHSRIVERAVYPLAILVKVTPIVAVAPLIVIWFGFGVWPKFIVAGLITFFPMLVNTITGLRTIDAATHDFFLALGASRWQVLWRLRLPSSLPYLFAGLRISIPLALIGAVIAEWIRADSGVGQMIVIAHGDFDTPTLFGAIVVLAVIGVALTAALALLERRFLFWHDSSVGP
ncbi:MAG: ABC transporter permease [Chloroflexi bacterium]|nr:ABC transporter permease [Chloroflexota bacterium]